MRKASTEGIAIQGQQGARLLPEQLLKEAFILSDLFDVGELAALELLLAGRVHLERGYDFEDFLRALLNLLFQNIVIFPVLYSLHFQIHDVTTITLQV